MKGIYRGYPLAILINALHLNLYVLFRDIWAKIKSSDEKNDIFNLIVSK